MASAPGSSSSSRRRRNKNKNKNSASELYTCFWGHEVRVSREDVEAEWDEDCLVEKILEMDNSWPFLDTMRPIMKGSPDSFQRVHSLTISCRICSSMKDFDDEGEIEVKVLLEAFSSAWEESDHGLDMPENIKILKVLPGVKPIEEDKYDYNPELTVVERPREQKYMSLRIIVKANMNRGFCHLGFDMRTGRIFRPIYRPQRGLCCWDEPLEVGKSYSFYILRSPGDGQKCVTPFPHCNEDLYIDKIGTTRIHDQLTAAGLFHKLQQIAKSSVEEIFGSQIKSDKYVDAGTNCPSVGILKCKGSDLRLLKSVVDNKIRRRMSFGKYSLPIPASNAEEYPYFPNKLPDRPTLVILGLGRPFGGFERQFQPFQPERCYILVVGILQI